jgi:hypothetical protein
MTSSFMNVDSAGSRDCSFAILTKPRAESQRKYGYILHQNCQSGSGIQFLRYSFDGRLNEPREPVWNLRGKDKLAPSLN